MPLIALLLAIASAFAQDPGEVRIVVRKSAFVLNVVQGDSTIRTYRIAVGKNPGNKQRRGDWRTPEGEFTVSQIQRSGHWVHDFGDGKGAVAGAYGPWFIRLNAGPWTGIGIHGTHDPSSLGAMVTEGCIRLANEDVEDLRRLTTVGTKVTIVP